MQPEIMGTYEGKPVSQMSQDVGICHVRIVKPGVSTRKMFSPLSGYIGIPRNSEALDVIGGSLVQ